MAAPSPFGPQKTLTLEQAVGMNSVLSYDCFQRPLLWLKPTSRSLRTLPAWNKSSLKVCELLVFLFSNSGKSHQGKLEGKDFMRVFFFDNLAGADMMKKLQLVVPAAVDIQKSVFEKYEFPLNQQGGFIMICSSSSDSSRRYAAYDGHQNA